MSSVLHSSHILEFSMDMSQSHFSQGRNLWIMRYCKACNHISLVQRYGSLNFFIFYKLLNKTYTLKQWCQNTIRFCLNQVWLKILAFRPLQTTPFKLYHLYFKPHIKYWILPLNTYIGPSVGNGVAVNKCVWLIIGWLVIQIWNIS